MSLAETFEVDIVFETQRLASVELFLKLPGDAQGWSGWSETGTRPRRWFGERGSCCWRARG